MGTGGVAIKYLTNRNLPHHPIPGANYAPYQGFQRGLVPLAGARGRAPRKDMEALFNSIVLCIGSLSFSPVVLILLAVAVVLTLVLIFKK